MEKNKILENLFEWLFLNNLFSHFNLTKIKLLNSINSKI